MTTIKSEAELCPDCGRPFEYEHTSYCGINIMCRIECPCVEDKRKQTRERGRQIIRDNTRSAIGLGKRTLRARFDNFRPDDGQHEAFRVSCSFAKQYIAGENDGTGLLLMGGVGSGKTHLAAAIAHAVIDNTDVPDDLAERAGIGSADNEAIYTGILFTGTVELMERIRAEYNGAQDAAGIIRRYQDARLLILDDLCAEKPSEWVQERLFQIIDHRYNEELPTIITTNETPDRLQHKLGDRIADRLRTMCRCVPIRSRSHRQTV